MSPSGWSTLAGAARVTVADINAGMLQVGPGAPRAGSTRQWRSWKRTPRRCRFPTEPSTP
jgi:hypothetical protein